MRQLQRLPAAALQCGERTRGHNCRSGIMMNGLRLADNEEELVEQDNVNEKAFLQIQAKAKLFL